MSLDLYSTIYQTIGNTPVVKLNSVVPANAADVYLKMESFNPTGSYKDRMAWAMIEEAEKRGELKSGMSVLEYTGGSTGTSLAFVCAGKGYPFNVVSTDATAKEKLDTMKAFGANLIMEQSVDGKTTPELIKRMIKKATELSKDPSTYFTDQLNNNDSILGYESIGRELVKQFEEITAFCGMVGTAGMIMGVSKSLKKANKKTKIIVLEPAESPFLSSGESGPHNVEGTGIGFAPPLLDKKFYDEIRTVKEEEGRQMARSLAKQEGIFVGTSSGLNVVGAIKLAKELGPGNNVVTVAVDTGLKYLDGDLFSGE
ncbi:MAG: cysteine synthase family protein [Candidatus Heimdallarchaeota archaeon]|nr:cysteine synthase family protein [Candidatus Heimdallarchaeota archaeon]